MLAQSGHSVGLTTSALGGCEGCGSPRSPRQRRVAGYHTITKLTGNGDEARFSTAHWSNADALSRPDLKHYAVFVSGTAWAGERSLSQRRISAGMNGNPTFVFRCSGIFNWRQIASCRNCGKQTQHRIQRIRTLSDRPCTKGREFGCAACDRVKDSLTWSYARAFPRRTSRAEDSTGVVDLQERTRRAALVRNEPKAKLVALPGRVERG